MAIIAPFRGMAYNIDKITNIENVVTPPYDVISEKDQDRYYKKSPYNIIRLILGKKKIGDSDWDNRYTRAADYFKRWKSEEILVRSSFPAIYLTSVEYEYDLPDNAGTRTRWGFIALVRIEENDSSVILPHEKTFSFHKEDRLKLMRECNAQFSPIFGLYEDPENVIMGAFDRIKASPAMISFRDRDGYFHKMWEINSNTIFKNISSNMSPKSIVIADGHHRYETARNFRNMMRARHGVNQPERSFEYTMMYLTDISDKGLTLLPTHRLLKSFPDFNITKFLSSARQWFDIFTFSFSANNELNIKKDFLQKLKEHGQTKTAIGFYSFGSGEYYLLSLKPGAEEEIGNDLHPSLKKLDVSILSRLVFQRILGIKRD
ncbi:MAG TPA: DUF1015 domain-containing protein, partial [Desulfatiglandales bacterium]|nr:DUF1015 domain-containing protein [Desulfatiglandales bacterium]